MKLFITGIGSGLGEALAELYLQSGARVYALGRKLPPSLEGYENLSFCEIDLRALEKIEGAMEKTVGDDQVDLAVLNAGTVGELKDMSETSLFEIQEVMALNVWANKVILDHFKKSGARQIVAISSGASVSGSRGWNAYAISKTSLNMLIRLYAQEMPASHLISLAPGLIETPMMKSILSERNEERFPVVKRLKNSSRLDPKTAARILSDSFAKLLEYPSGTYVDIREM